MIGAGFNVGANNLVVGNPQGARYPLTAELGALCFGRSPDAGESIEAMFDRALSERNWAPLTRLLNTLLAADYYIADALSQTPNHYTDFLRFFPSSHFLTFNYDALLELLLFRLGRWRPEDGYGLPVDATLTSAATTLPECSTNLVLHLHGSSCVSISTHFVEYEPNGRTIEGTIRQRDTPLFSFDPLQLARRFSPYRPFPMRDVTTPREPRARVIAPVPSKARREGAAFVHAVHEKAAALLRAAGRVVAIGYSFNPVDIDSYAELLTNLRATGKVLTVVAPNALDAREHLLTRFPGLGLTALPYTFEQWAQSGYYGYA